MPSEGPGDLVWQDRGEFFDHAVDFTEVLAVETVDGSFLVSTTGGARGRELFAERASSQALALRRVLAVLDRLDRLAAATDGVLIATRANVGGLIVPAIRRHDFGGALCFEPNPRERLLCRLNCALNDISDVVEIHPFEPVSGYAGIDRLLGDSELTGSGLLWIAAEGHELEILRGASKLSRTGVPIVLEGGVEPLAEHRLVGELLALIGGRYDVCVPLSSVDAGMRLGGKRFRQSVIWPIDQLGRLAAAEPNGTAGVLMLPER